MTRPLSRKEKTSIGFLVVWMIFWGGGMLLVVLALGGAAMAGDVAPMIFMIVWLVAAGFGLYRAGRQLRTLLMRDGQPRRPPTSQPWHDGMTERPKLEPMDATWEGAPEPRVPVGRTWNDGMPGRASPPSAAPPSASPDAPPPPPLPRDTDGSEPR